MSNELKQKIRLYTEKEKADFFTHKNPYIILRKRTEFFDTLILDLLGNFKPQNLNGAFFIGAVGGYGRREMYPKSDIDLLIVHKRMRGDELKVLMESIILPLMDAKVDVGYAFREFSDLPDDLDKDLITVTSYLNIRYLAGSYKLYDSWHETMFKPFISKKRGLYATKKIEEYGTRLERFNQSPYILEPNIKEGIGGLREFHYIIWLGKVLFGIEDFDSLCHLGLIDGRELRLIKEGFRFLSSVRCHMHFFHYVQKEILSFELQEETADFLGYAETSEGLKVEHFMRDYHRHTHDVFLISSKIFHNYSLHLKKRVSYTRKELDHGIYLEGFGGGEINVYPTMIKDNLRLLFKCFYYSKKLKKNLSYRTRNYIKELSERVNILKWDDELVNLFYQIISPDKPFSSEIVMEMYNSGFLEILFPEFKKIHHKMQFDAYHIYTVDIHSIFAVQRLGNFFSENREDIALKIKKPALLALAVLLHDIGKGSGKDHADKGAAISDAIAGHMGLDIKDRELLAFLVRKHLVLATIAQSRDISDTKYLERVFRDEIKNIEMLEYLYFLTVADLMAVGEGVWNAWKERLLKTLFLNLRMIAEKKGGETYFPEEQLLVKKSALIENLVSQDLQHLTDTINILPDSYLLLTDIPEMIRDMKIDHEFSRSPEEPYIIDIIPNEAEKISEVIIAAKDEKGLFSQFSGAMTLVGFNILSAAINTRKNGNVLDVFFVDLGKREYEVDECMHEKLNDYLKKIVIHKEKVDDLVTSKAKRYHKKSYFKEKNAVVFDNNSSDDFTIIDVFAGDHMGLLFEITRTLSALGLNIYFSRISTLGDRAVDVFYVLKDNKKIHDEKELDHIRTTILKAIAY
jgi:[protein-PII] uridylyltransferase